MAQEWWPTVSNVISDAAIALGLASATISNPYASTDPNILQLNQFLADVGMDLLREHDWQQFQLTHQFTTVISTTNYDPPAGFHRFLNQTHWNRTTDLELRGPLTPGEWQQVQATGLTSTVSYFMRYYQSRLFLTPTPTAEHNIAYEYISRYWAAPAAGPASPTKEVPTISTDVLHFDRRLLAEGVKSRFRVEKGFAQQETYSRWLRNAKGSAGLAPILSLNGGGSLRERMLDRYNLPDTYTGG